MSINYKRQPWAVLSNARLRSFRCGFDSGPPSFPNHTFASAKLDAKPQHAIYYMDHGTRRCGPRGLDSVLRRSQGAPLGTFVMPACSGLVISFRANKNHLSFIPPRMRQAIAHITRPNKCVVSPRNVYLTRLHQALPGERGRDLPNRHGTLVGWCK
jgi:hypothetical protein